MKITANDIIIIKDRIQSLKVSQAKRLYSIGPYSKLPEQEKIPLRVNIAEIQALEYLMLSKDLDKIQRTLVENEQYCGAEGINKVKNWWVQLKGIPLQK